MFACETQILQRLAILVVCHDLAMGQIISYDLLVQGPMSWFKAQEFCQRHYVNLAVLSTEEQYFTFLNATAANKVSFWLGLQRLTTFSGWKWVNGEELSYDHWYRRNYEGHCASLEAMLKKENKLLARYCDEAHMFLCQGPVAPQPVTVDSVGSDHVVLSWNVSAFMQMTPHSYNVTTCTNTCDTLFCPYPDGSAFMNISISDLTSATEYFIEISTFVVRPDSVTGGNMTLKSNSTAFKVKTVDSGAQYKVIIIILKSLKLMPLVPSLWIIYHILRKCKSLSLDEVKESDHDISQSSVELPTEDTIVYLIPQKNRGFG
ncbi:uncharacterized protein LOC127376060 isoform X1 [Dicentrarchus labrax]|uniref:uncharacterized protein LOC127376060 isoform X1 n=1 Tax=Dicentrarchus labrax TaxID=13489 RepID=UPI0021F5186D|nr:uncharacterized protein LOC127376060 isoform X1 [Dicentrarchus labrax]